LSSVIELGATSIRSTPASLPTIRQQRSVFGQMFFAESDCWSAFPKARSHGQNSDLISVVPKVIVLRVVHGARDLPRLLKLRP
jgi:hypothetical protein